MYIHNVQSLNHLYHRSYRLRKWDWKPLTWAIERAHALRLIVHDQRRPGTAVLFATIDGFTQSAWPGLAFRRTCIRTWLTCSSLNRRYISSWYGSAQSHGVKDRPVWRGSIDQLHACWLSARSSEQSVNPRWHMEDLETTYVHSCLSKLNTVNY